MAREQPPGDPELGDPDPGEEVREAIEASEVQRRASLV
jgi:hypothetical protein